MQELVKIERMGQGPEAVGHLASGKAVFVLGAAPDDVALVDVFEEKPSFARATIVELETPSPYRVEARWNEAASASLAPWQHLSYESQLTAKRENVIAALTRIAKLPDEFAQDLVRPVQGSKREWGYRNKVELGTARNAAGKLILGFHDESTHNLLESARCPLACRTVEQFPKALQGALRYLEGAQDLGIYRVGMRSSLRTGETEIALWTPASSFPRNELVKTLSSSLKTTSIVRVLADEGKARKVKKVEVLSGKGCWSEDLCGARFMASAPSFFQVNTAQAEKLVKFAIEQLGGTYDTDGPRGLEGRSIADLYAGGGTFSIPLALADADVVAVEAEGSSVRDLRRNAEANGVYVDVMGGDAARILPTLGHLDALIVDPPRAGLAPSVVGDIAAAGPEKVIYISCNPSTWARDVRRFVDARYELTSVQPVDLFPQSFHVEVASVFTRCAS